MPSISKIEKALIDIPKTNDWNGWAVLGVSPVMKTWAAHTDDEETIISGIWEAETGTYHVSYNG